MKISIMMLILLIICNKILDNMYTTSINIIMYFYYAVQIYYSLFLFIAHYLLLIHNM